MQINDTYLTINGLRAHTYSAGEQGPCIVLLHGGGVDSGMLSWKDALPHLAKTYRVFAPEYPGWGESQLPDGPVTQEFLVDFILAYLDEMHIERATLAGISLGGAIALGVTLQAPARVERLVLIDSYGLQRKAPFNFISNIYLRIPYLNQMLMNSMRSPKLARMTLQTFMKKPGSITDDLIADISVELVRPTMGRAWATYQRSEVQWKGTRTCYLDRLAEIQAPTLLIQGGADNLVPVECVREAHTRIHGSRLEILPGCGHWPQRDDPQAFMQALSGFLNETN